MSKIHKKRLIYRLLGSMSTTLANEFGTDLVRRSIREFSENDNYWDLLKEAQNINTPELDKVIGQIVARAIIKEDNPPRSGEKKEQ